MNTIYPILITSIAGFATILGNILLFLPLKYKDKILSFALGLSFIVMFLISVGELIPEGLGLVKEIFSIKLLFLFSFILLFVGYFSVIIIDKKIDNNDTLYKVGILSMISLLIHNIPEGIICAITSSVDLRLGLKFSLIILVHNIPEGICISLPIYYATKSKMKAFIYTLISSGGEIVGALVTMLFLKNFITPIMLYIVFIVTAGIMITLSVLKILKEGLNLKQYLYLIIGIVFGLVIVYYTL